VQKHGSRRTVTEICVRAEPSRNAIIVEQRSSGVPAIDRLARRAMERALRERAMPADLGSCNACYSFVVTHGRSLPTPSLSCDLDTLKCKPPASGTLEKQVLLVWVLHDSERVSGTRP
jgi:hypothetical protein